MNTEGQRVKLSLKDLEAYLNQGPGMRAGKKLRFYCPIHGSDHQRSLEVDPETGHFKCYACGAWGYLEEFSPVVFNPLSDRELGAWGYLEEFSQKNYKPVKAERPEPKPSESLAKIQKELYKALPNSIGEEYLKQRGISLQLAQAYGGGYAAFGKWPHFVNGKPVRQWQQGRVTFPHTNPKGEIVNLYGRAVGTDVPKEERHDHLPGPKGVFNAPALNAETVFICEGVFDALSLIAAGYTNAVAIFGVNGLRWEWVKAKKVVFCLDQDQAGQQWRDLAWYATVVLGKEAFFLSPDVYRGCKDLNEVWAKYRTLDIGFSEDRAFTTVPPEEKQEIPEKPAYCRYCGGTDFWLASWGWVCRKCHPPYEEVLKEWEEKHKKGGAINGQADSRF